MLTVSGRFKLSGQYSVELDITEDEFYSLTTRKQNELLDSSINWVEATSQAELDDIDVDEIVEIVEGEEV